MTRCENILKAILPPDSTVWAYKNYILLAMTTLAIAARHAETHDIVEWLHEDVGIHTPSESHST